MPDGSPPPEVPEEFAAVYRAAYEQSLAAQGGGPQDRDDLAEHHRDVAGSEADGGSAEGADQIPVRRRPLRIGTNRGVAYRKLRDAPAWLAPLVLTLLVLLLVLGAYWIGRAFAGQATGHPRADQVSRIIVTGPSPASSTVISAPKTPRSTCVPCSSRPSQTAR